MTQAQLPQVIADRLNNIVTGLGEEPTRDALHLAHSNMLNIIASMVTATSASLLRYHSDTKLSRVIAEYDSKQSGVLERRSDMGEEFDEREYKIAFQWISSAPKTPHHLHLNQLPNNATERREMQRYAVLTALYVPINTADNTFWGYIELWESRYKRVFTDQEQQQLLAATAYLTKIITLF